MVGNGVATMENSMVDSPKVKHRITIWSGNFSPGNTPNSIESKDLDTCTPVVMAALFTIAKRLKQPQTVWRGVDKKIWYIHIWDYH